MKRVFCLFCSFVLLFSGTVFGGSAHAQEYTGDISAKSAVLIDATTGEVLYAKNETEERAMASTTKIMTALLTLEQENLDEYFTVDSEAIQVEGSSMGLVEGDQVTLRALAYGMLLPSGNDAANAAAVKIGGTVEDFVGMMNERAKAIGLQHTNFVTPSGLDAEGHHSTAYDMAMLAREALKNENFRQICSSANAQLEYGNSPYKRWLKNSNKMLTNYEGAIGVKTGFTDEAGRCLVTAATRDGVTLICVTLSDPNDWQDTANLLDYGFSRVSAHEIPQDLTGDLNAVITGGTQNTCKLQLYGAATTTASVDELTAQVHLDRFYFAPVTAGDILGRVDYCYKGEVVASQPLMAAEDVAVNDGEPEKGGFWDSFVRAINSILDFMNSFSK